MMYWLYNETKLISKYAKFPPLRLQIKLLDNEYFLELQKIIKQSNGPESFVQKEEANHFCLNIFAFEANKNLSKH